jgi:hypothetical protein
MSSIYTQGLLLDSKILSEQTLLDIYNKAVKLLLEGKTFMEFDGEGSNFKAQFPIPVQQMLSEARYALKQKNPAKYGHITTQVKPFFI